MASSSAASSSSRGHGYRTAASVAAAVASITQETATPSHQAPSALMTSLFSPPLTLSQNAVAEAGALAVSSFSVPPAFGPVIVNQPDPQSVMVHSIVSSSRDAGLQAVIILHPKTEIPSHLGLPSPPTSSPHEETAFLMAAPRNQPFVLYSQAPKALVMQISVTEYLTLMTFFAKEWPRVRSKLLLQASTMQEGTDPVPLTTHLVFYSHGMSCYSISLSNRLVFKAKIDSRKLREKDECLRAWLEQPRTGSSSNNGGHGGPQEWICPLAALSSLAQDESSLKALTDVVTTYKNRGRKRSKPVA